MQIDGHICLELHELSVGVALQWHSMRGNASNFTDRPILLVQMIVDVDNEENITLTTSGAETLILRQNKINTMTADALATQGAGSSADMVLTMQSQRNLDFHMKVLTTYAILFWWKCTIYFFVKVNVAWQDLKLRLLWRKSAWPTSPKWGPVKYRKVLAQDFINMHEVDLPLTSSLDPTSSHSRSMSYRCP